MMYVIAVDKNSFDQFIETATIEYNKGKIKCKRLTGKWISCFKDAIRGKEQEDFSMTGKYARFNDNVKHHDGNWFVATSKLD